MLLTDGPANPPREDTPHQKYRAQALFRSREAESVAIVSRLSNIQNAGKRGDWKADSWYLERTQREIFGNNDNKNNALAVQINIHRDNQVETVDVSTTGAKPVTLDD